MYCPAQPDLFPLNTAVTAPSPYTPSRYAQCTIRRALNLLERQLREPSAAASSSAVPRLGTPATGEGRAGSFIALFLDNQHRLIARETLFSGTINRTEVHPREVVKSALGHNAAAVIVAHCHPSGLAEPSQADRQITERLRESTGPGRYPPAGPFLVVGGMDIVSFAERGWL